MSLEPNIPEAELPPTPKPRAADFSAGAGPSDRHTASVSSTAVRKPSTGENGIVGDRVRKGMNATPGQIEETFVEAREKINSLLISPELDEKTQVILAKIVTRMDTFQRYPKELPVNTLLAAVNALTMQKPSVALAKKLQWSLFVLAIRAQNPFGVIGSSTVRKVMVGLTHFLYICIPLGFLLLGLLKRTDLGTSLLQTLNAANVNPWKIVAIAVFGAFGSAVSIMVRLDEFAKLSYPDSFLPYLIGITKPIIGIGFALFLYALFSSNLMPAVTGFTGVNAKYGWLAVAFLAGFSERFATDFASRAEAGIGGKAPPQVDQGHDKRPS